jgi:hypothetical protein
MWKRKILRKVHGPVTEKGVWKIRTNQELLKLFKPLNLIADTERRNLKSLGHVIRMDQTRIPKKFF